MNDYQIHQAESSDLDGMKQLLARHHLPVDDIGHGASHRFLISRDRGHLVGAVGLELYGTVALLRSLVVADLVRRLGLGQQLLDAAEGLARHDGVQTVYLLTTDASTYFLSRAYQFAARDQAPEAIRTTRQFAGLCPSSSTLMSKAL